MTVLVMAAAFLAWTYREPATSALEAYLVAEEADPVPTLRLSYRTYRVLAKAEGELTGLKMTPVVAPRVRRGGLTIGWLAEEGSLVSPGDVLVRFDSSEAELALAENQNRVLTLSEQISKSESEGEAGLRMLEVDKQSAGMELDFVDSRVRRDEDIFSRWEIQESLMSKALAQFKQLSVEEKTDLRGRLSGANLKILGIEQASAGREVNLAREALSSLELSASVGGVLFYKTHGWRKVEVGGSAWPGQTLVEIADLNRFRARLSVPESEISGIEKGQAVEITLHALPGRTLRGKVAMVAAVANQVSRNDPRKYFDCNIDLEVPIELLDQLKPGMRVVGEIEILQSEEGIILPKSAVFREEDRFVVFTEEGSTYSKQDVSILASDHGFYIVDGLTPGQLACLRHPHDRDRLHLPDFNAPSAASQKRRFVMLVE